MATAAWYSKRFLVRLHNPLYAFYSWSYSTRSEASHRVYALRLRGVDPSDIEIIYLGAPDRERKRKGLAAYRAPTVQTETSTKTVEPLAQPEPAPYVGIPGDADKPRPALLHNSMARAVAAVIRVLTYGAKKHSPDGWASVEDVDRVYLEKIYRHLSAEALGENIEPESGELHAACVAADALIRLEMQLRERERRS